MKKNKSKLAIIIFAIFLCAYIIIPQGKNIQFHYDYPVAFNLNEMIDASEYIVIGEYSGFEKAWNMARNPKDISQEDSENYVEGRLYNFSISEVLKGNIDESDILINHRHLESVNIETADLKVIEDSTFVKKQTIILRQILCYLIPYLLNLKMGKLISYSY